METFVSGLQKKLLEWLEESSTGALAVEIYLNGCTILDEITDARVDGGLLILGTEETQIRISGAEKILVHDYDIHIRTEGGYVQIWRD